MGFEQALAEFLMKIRRDYNIEDGITKIGLHPELYRRVMEALWKNNPYASFRLEDLCEPRVMGVHIVPRQKDNF